MSQGVGYRARMMKRALSPRKLSPVQLSWSHFGVLHRATVWPDVQFESHVDGKWVPFDPDPSTAIFSAAAVMVGRAEWKQYLDFMPARERAFVEGFTSARLSALAVLVRCPALLPLLEEVPALTSFVSLHRDLRGTPAAAWQEIEATYERGGIYGLLEWLGLPACRDTLDALSNVDDPEISRRHLERVREALWNPAVAATFAAADSYSETQIVSCHAMAAA